MAWNSPDEKKSGFIAGAAIFAIVAATFAVNCRNDFVRVDDMDYIAQNPNIRRGLTPRSVLWSATAVGYSSNWHPLTWISHALDVTIAREGGIDYAEPENPAGMWARTSSPFAKFVHAENVLLHVANALLLFFLIVLLLPNRSPLLPLVCTLLWAVHPLRVEVVAWASERKELLSVFFMLLTLIAYVRDKGRDGTFSLFTFIFSLLSKPVAVSLPAVLLAGELIRDRADWRGAVRRVWPFALCSLVTCALTLWAQTDALSVGRTMPLGTKALCSLAAPIVYLWQTVCPTGLAFDYAAPEWSSAWPVAAAGVVLLVLMAAVCIRWLRHPTRLNGIGLLAVVWCYVGLVPMLGVVKVGSSPHSDRYTYWIGCGLCVCLALALEEFAPRRRSVRRLLASVALTLTVLLAGLSVRQSLVWKDNLSLLGDTVPRTHGELYSYVLADELAFNGRADEAEKVLRETEAAKRTPMARGALALFLAENGKTAEADRLADRALTDERDCYYALGAKGLVALAGGDKAAARDYLERALAGFDSERLRQRLERLKDEG